MASKKETLEKVETKSSVSKVRKLTDDTLITVIGNFSGDLFYRSPRTQDEWRWAYGDEDEMSVRELKTMKAQHRKFFEDKWITFAEKDQDVISHLKIEKYYKDGFIHDDMETIFENSVEDLADIIETSTPNEKSLIINKAREQYESGELKDIHIIKLIEDKLQVDVDISNPK